MSIGFSVLRVGKGQTVGFELLTLLLKIMQGLQEVFQLPPSLSLSLTQPLPHSAHKAFQDLDLASTSLD